MPQLPASCEVQIMNESTIASYSNNGTKSISTYDISTYELQRTVISRALTSEQIIAQELMESVPTVAFTDDRFNLLARGILKVGTDCKILAYETGIDQHEIEKLAEYAPEISLKAAIVNLQQGTPSPKSSALELKREVFTRIKVIDAVDFMSIEFPPRENILSPWLPSQGLAMVYAPRGIGKTHFSLGLAYAVSSGGEFLRWKTPSPRSVLFLDGEMPAIALQERIAKIAVSNEKEPVEPFRIITPDMQPSGMIDLSRIADQNDLQQHLKNIDLIIVDNLSTLCRSGKENEGEAWLPVQQWALQQRSAGKSVLFIHHAGKNGEQRGTSRREDVLDTVIALKRPGDYTPDMGACFEVNFEKARGLYGEDTKPFEARLMTAPDGLQTWAMKNLEASNAEKVAKLLNEGVPQHEIAELLNVAKGTVSKAKKKAAEMGLLKNEVS